MTRVTIEDTLYPHFSTSSSTTGAATDADAAGVAIEEDGAAMAYTPAIVKVATGLYRTTIAATTANGFEVGKRYAAWVEASVGGVVGRAPLVEFEVTAAEIPVNVTRINSSPIAGDGTPPVYDGGGAIISPGDPWRKG